MSNKNIIISSIQFPFYGGASTVAYAMIKQYKQMNHNVLGIFFNKSNANIDPHNLGNVYLLKPTISIYDKFLNSNYRFTDDISPKSVTNIKKKMPKPDVILCIGMHTVSYMREIYPDSKIFLIVSGLNLLKASSQINMPITELIKDINLFETNKKLTKGRQDVEDMNNANLIIANSPDMLNYYLTIYPEFKHKIYNKYLDTSSYVEIFNNPIVNLETNKDIDILIIASRLDRPEKNNEFLIPILKSSLFDKYKKCFIGANYEMFEDISNSICTGLLSDRVQIDDYYRRSKVILVASLFESAGNVVREALYNKCLSIISINVGFHEKFQELYVCKSFDETEWSQKIIYIVDNYAELIKTYNVDFSNNFTLNDVLDI